MTGEGMLYFSRARLRRDAPAAALRPLLVPATPEARISTDHRLIWSLFADGPHRRRDFLWRAAESGRYYILSARRPNNFFGLFEIDTTEFAPQLVPGERLSFLLRANAAVAGRDPGDPDRIKRHDVVMHAIRD